MDLTLQRLRFTPRSTGSDLLLGDGITRLYALELPVKDGMPGSAIPPGRYKITLEPSPKFLSSMDAWVQRYAQRIPHINGIPHRSHILIHWGNYPDDTDGCVLVGLTQDLDFVGASRPAFSDLMDAIGESAAAGDCWLNVQGGLPMRSHDPPQLGADESTQI